MFGRLHVLPVMVEFLRAYPEIDIRMMPVDHVLNLLDDQIDLAVRIGELPDSSLVATRGGAIRRVVCGSPAHFAARGTPRHPDKLERHDCISFDGMMAAHTLSFAAGKSELTVAIRPRLVVNTAEAAVDAACAGIGITRVLSYQAADAVRRGELALALRPFEPPPLPVHLVHAGRGLLPLKLRAFLDFATPRLRAALTW